MYRPKELTAQLGVSSATLRRWSDLFSAHLSPTAGKALTSAGGSAQRRYTDGDVLVLHRVKQLLDAGYTYEETARQLKNSAHLQSSDDASGASGAEPALVPSLSASLMSDSMVALEAFRETLTAKDETIAAQHETIMTQRQALAQAEELNAELLALTRHQREMLAKAHDTQDAQRMTLLQRIDGLLRGHMIRA